MNPSIIELFPETFRDSISQLLVDDLSAWNSRRSESLVYAHKKRKEDKTIDGLYDSFIRLIEALPEENKNELKKDPLSMDLYTIAVCSKQSDNLRDIITQAKKFRRRRHLINRERNVKGYICSSDPIFRNIQMDQIKKYCESMKLDISEIAIDTDNECHEKLYKMLSTMKKGDIVICYESILGPSALALGELTTIKTEKGIIFNSSIHRSEITNELLLIFSMKDIAMDASKKIQDPFDGSVKYN